MIRMIKSSNHLVVNFSLKKEVFIIAIGSFVGAFTMHLPRIFLDLFGDSSYQIMLLVFARVVNSSQPEVGLALHLFVATIIGIVTGVFLHKIFRFNISSIPRGLVYGIISGVVVFVVFAIPVSQIFLGPNTIEIILINISSECVKLNDNFHILIRVIHVIESIFD